MRVLRFLHGKRMVLTLVLTGLLASASGCSDPNPATSVAPEEAKAKGEALGKAMGDAMKNAQRGGRGGGGSAAAPK
jgi:hypothetical protein